MIIENTTNVISGSELNEPTQINAEPLTVISSSELGPVQTNIQRLPNIRKAFPRPMILLKHPVYDMTQIQAFSVAPLQAPPMKLKDTTKPKVSTVQTPTTETTVSQSF